MANIDLKQRFWVFCIDEYYPVGGLADVCGTFDTVDEAIALAIKSTADSRSVFDAATRETVWLPD